MSAQPQHAYAMLRPHSLLEHGWWYYAPSHRHAAFPSHRLTVSPQDSFAALFVRLRLTSWSVCSLSSPSYATSFNIDTRYGGGGGTGWGSDGTTLPFSGGKSVAATRTVCPWACFPGWLIVEKGPRNTQDMCKAP